jgi:hypothetical protein
MESLIKKTGLGIAVQSAITQEGLQAEESTLMTIFYEVFNQKFEEFKKIHNHNFPSITVKGNYLIDNEFPIGENDKQQYFRCLAHDVKIGNISLTFDVNDQKRKFTVIEGYSRNDENKKRSYSKGNSSKKGYPKGHGDSRAKKRQKNQ